MVSLKDGAATHMRVISNKALREFGQQYPDADLALQTWRKIMEKSAFKNFSELKNSFNSVDRVGPYYVFNIGGNKFRLIVRVDFQSQAAYIRAVYTHADYDKWSP